MPFILVAVLIDMISIGLMVPVLPHIVGQFTSSNDEQTLGLPGGDADLRHRQLPRLADPRRAVRPLRPAAGAAARLCRPGAQLLRHRGGHGAVDAGGGAHVLRRDAEQHLDRQRLRGRHHAARRARAPLRPDGRDVRHRLHPRARDRRHPRRHRRAAAVRRGRHDGADQLVLRLLRAARVAAARSGAAPSTGGAPIRCRRSKGWRRSRAWARWCG